MDLAQFSELGGTIIIALALVEVLKHVIGLLFKKIDKNGNGEKEERVIQSLERLVRAQDALAIKLAELDHRFADHDKADAIVFAKITDTLGRLDDEFREHDRRVMEAVSLQREIREKVSK